MSELGPTLTSSDRTATEELRRLLDERGVEWKGQEDIHTDFTFWCGVHACETGPKPSLAVYNLTPEQAIAATLGDTDATGGRQCDAGTCELINAADDLGKGTSSCMCFECGYTAIDDWWDEFKYCPNCGRRIEVDEC